MNAPREDAPLRSTSPWGPQNDTTPSVPPPVAKMKPVERIQHGDRVVDGYAWLAEKDDPETIAYLEAENEYTGARTAHLADLRERIFQEIKARTQETDLSVPARKGAYWYYARTVEGQQYAIHARVPVGADPNPPVTTDGSPLPGEEILVDGNVLAGDSAFFALGTLDISPDGNLLAYSTDLSGDERFTLRVKDLRTGEPLPDEIPDTYYGSAWSRDGSTLFYLTVNDAWRSDKLWRHTLGTPREQDVLVLEEPDERFSLGVELSRSERYVLVGSQSKVTSEWWMIPADAPHEAPRGIAPRRQGVEYEVEHDATGHRFLILHNLDAEDFALASTPADSPGEWTTLIPHTPGTRLLSVDAFAGHLVVYLRRAGLTGVRVLPSGGEPFEIEFPEPLYTVGLDANPDYDTDSIRLAYDSLITPDTIYDYQLPTGSLVLRRRKPVLPDLSGRPFDPDDYEQFREWAEAADGTRIPISIVARKGTPRDGSAPAMLYGYGSYEYSTDPWFSIARLSLMDRGFIFAIAHVRGGGELGRRWYEEGKLLAKKNTFTDFVAAAEHLAKTGWTAPERLVARGGSAGGLLVGAVANLAPSAFAGVVAQVPFVDALNTILDPSLPLTVTEWEEWGNPLESPEVYAYMKSYTPYENVAPVAYPKILAMTSLHDTRVLFHEPAKWIARLRAVAPEGDYLLKTEMGAGHAGPSGRYDAWRDEAFILAWMIDVVNRAAAG